ncbi:MULTISPECIES: hypothetical protein [Salinibaculum]|uniref:hypothetical protein n=1 Tax=Salinibaculum TaxID=2732368 RepID=UPI0030D3452D
MAVVGMTDATAKIARYLAITINRLIAGRYSRREGISIGIVIALLVGLPWYFVVPIIDPVLSPLPTVSFTTDSLTALWGIHATVITLILVALSFAWQSVRNLPTTPEVVEDLANKLRSIETITFLFAANLLVGLGVILSTGQYVMTDVGLSVGALLLVSVVVTIHRFWVVFSLLLHNTLDETVMKFAAAARTGKYGKASGSYDAYLEHFFDAAKADIEQNRPRRLEDTLGNVTSLMIELDEEDHEVEIDQQLLGFVRDRYLGLHRRSLEKPNEELEDKVITSYGAIFYGVSITDETKIACWSLETMPQFLTQKLAEYPESGGIEQILSRFEEFQHKVLASFDGASSLGELETSVTVLDAWFATQTSLWRRSIEGESRTALAYLHHLLDDIFQFRRYEHAPPVPRGEEDATDDVVGDVNRQKQQRADQYRVAINRLRFAAYGWVLKLFRADELQATFLEHVLSEYAESKLDDIERPSEIYFGMRDEGGRLSYWERWNLNHALDDNYGSATTGMSVNTWLLDFYCTMLVWTLDFDTMTAVRDRSPESSVILESEADQHTVDKITDRIASYRTNYPLKKFHDEYPPIDQRCNVLIRHFKDIKTALDEQKQQWVRKQPLDEGRTDGLAEKVNSQLESSGLRTVLAETGEIKQGEVFGPDVGGDFSGAVVMPRRIFVDDGVSTFFGDRFTQLLQRYRNFVVEHLNFEERTINKFAELPDVLADIAANHEVRAFVVEQVDGKTVLRDDDRSEREHTDSLGSYLSFCDVPVVTESMSETAAIAVFDAEFEYAEDADDHPISVSVTPGEDVEGWNAEDLADGADIRDKVHVQFTYRAHIDSTDNNGIVIDVPRDTS